MKLCLPMKKRAQICIVLLMKNIFLNKAFSRLLNFPSSFKSFILSMKASNSFGLLINKLDRFYNIDSLDSLLRKTGLSRQKNLVSKKATNIIGGIINIT